MVDISFERAPTRCSHAERRRFGERLIVAHAERPSSADEVTTGSKAASALDQR